MNRKEKRKGFLAWLFSVEGLLCAALLALGIVLRLINVTDPPLDFHPTRQLRSAIIARGMYTNPYPAPTPNFARQRCRFGERWKLMNRLF
jgi:hypothetical protein